MTDADWMEIIQLNNAYLTYGIEVKRGFEDHVAVYYKGTLLPHTVDKDLRFYKAYIDGFVRCLMMTRR